MSSPASANRTLWLNASDADHLFTSKGPPPSGAVSDGSLVDAWNDEDAADILAEVDLGVPPAGKPTWDNNGISGIGDLIFDGVGNNMRLTNDAISSPKTLADLITATEFTLFFVFQLTADATNKANLYENTQLWGGPGAHAIYFKTSGGTSTVHLLNDDGSIDSVSKTINKNQTYVLMCRHQGGNIYISVNNGSETSIASGNTTPLTYFIYIGYNQFSLGDYFPGKIGEVLIYNAALTGSNFTDTMAYLMDKWVTTSNFSVSPKDSFELVGGLGAQDFVSMLIDGDRLNLRELVTLDNNYVLKLTAQAFDSLFYGLGDNATAAILNTLLTVSKSDALSLSDARQLRLLIARTAADIFTIADDRYLRLQYRLRPTDTFNLLDFLAVSAQLAAQSVSQSDSLSLSDVASPVVSSQIRISIDN